MSPNSLTRAQEDGHAHNSEVTFRVVARRNKLLGLWSANQLGFSPEAADAYAHGLVLASLEETGDDAVTRKILKDFKMRGTHIQERDIRGEMAKLYDVALGELSNIGKLASTDLGPVG